MLEDEDEEEEEREDVPALTDRTVPAAAPGEDEGEAAAAEVGGAERRDDPAEPDGGETENSAGKITDGGGDAPIPAPAPIPAFVPAFSAVERAEDFADNPVGADGGASVRPPKRPAGEAAGVDGGGSAQAFRPFTGETAGADGSMPAEKLRRSAGEAARADGGAAVEAVKPVANETAGMDGAAPEKLRHFYETAETGGAVSAERPEHSVRERAAETDGDDFDTEKEPEDVLIWKLDIGAAQRAEAAWRRALADRPDGAAAEAVRTTAEGTMGTVAERLSVEKGGELARVVRHESQSGLEGLYWQTVQAVRPSPQALPAEQAGRTVRAEEPGRTVALTVDELDRAVRRDSRRYDGGMTIF